MPPRRATVETTASHISSTPAEWMASMVKADVPNTSNTSPMIVKNLRVIPARTIEDCEHTASLALETRVGVRTGPNDLVPLLPFCAGESCICAQKIGANFFPCCTFVTYRDQHDRKDDAIQETERD